MTTLTDQGALSVHARAGHALARVSVTLATCSDSNVADGIEIRLEHLRISEDLITEGVQTIQRDTNVCGCHPVLQFQAAFKVDATGTSLERGEGNFTITQRRNIAVLARAQSMCLALALAYGSRIGQGVDVPTDSAIVLIGYPVAVLRGALVDGKGLRTWRTEQNTYVGDIVGFS